MSGVKGIRNLREIFNPKHPVDNGFGLSNNNFYLKNPNLQRMLPQTLQQTQKLPVFNVVSSKQVSPRSTPISPRNLDSKPASTKRQNQFSKTNNAFFQINRLHQNKDGSIENNVQSNITRKQNNLEQLERYNKSNRQSPVDVLLMSPVVSHNNSILHQTPQSYAMQQIKMYNDTQNLMLQKLQLSIVNNKNLRIENSQVRNPNERQLRNSNQARDLSKKDSKDQTIRGRGISYDDENGQRIDTKQSQLTHKLDPGYLTKALFKFQYIIGKGGFGKVWKVELKKTRQLFALKEMGKAKILSKKSVHSVMNERTLLTQLRHPLVANIHYAFQDRDNLFLIMDLLTGGDLRYHLGKVKYFTEIQIKFFCACIILALEYLHNNNIIHRDIKPENLVFDKKGYLRVTDLGIARVIRPENNMDTSGTPGYMAPEVMCRQNHGIAVDYYAVGVIAYEFMVGKRPYLGKSRREIRDAILSKQIQVKKADIPYGWSTEAADFINRMIQRKPQNRLGYGGPDEVKQHPWFYNFNWQRLLKKELISPFIPLSIEDNTDYQRQISSDHDSQDETIQENQILLRRDSIQSNLSI